MSVYVPVGYVPMKDWLTEEFTRRGKPDGMSVNKELWPVFDALANYLGQNDDEKCKLALCVTNSGLEIEIPIRVWRQKPEDRARIAQRWQVRFHAGGWGSSEWEGRVVVRASLRLDRPAAAAPNSSNAEPAKSKGGNPGKWDWERGISDTWEHIYSDAPDIKTVADIIRIIQDKMTDASGNAPVESDARKRAKIIFEALKRD